MLIRCLSCSVVNIQFVQVHPEARSLRVKTLPGYRKLCVIFGEESSDTRYIRLSHNADPRSELPVFITGMFLSLITIIRQYNRHELVECSMIVFVLLPLTLANSYNHISYLPITIF